MGQPVSWVRIPPSPNKIGLALVRPDFILYGYCIEVSILRRADGAIILSVRNRTIQKKGTCLKALQCKGILE